MRSHDRPLPGLRVLLPGQAAGEEPRAARPGHARAVRRGVAAGDRHRRPGRHRPACRAPAGDPRGARHRHDGDHRGRQSLQGAGLRRHRAHRPRAAGRPPRLLHPADAQPRDLRSARGARHSPRAGVRRRADRPARARGLHPEPRQGGRPWRHVAAGLRHRRRRGCGRVDPGLPAVAEVGVRLGAGRAHRHVGEGAGRAPRLAAPPGRQGRAGHRRRPRHRRADRPGARARRGHRRRGRRAAGGRRPDPADQGAGR